VQLGTSARHDRPHVGKTEGQILRPEVNGMLMIACVALVLGFRESSNLAAAYGIAVTGTMGWTSLLFYSWPTTAGADAARAGTLLVLFLSFDLSFFVACSAKIAHGGWFPLMVAVAIFTTMMTWKLGRPDPRREGLRGLAAHGRVPRGRRPHAAHRVAGTAVFLASPGRDAAVLLHHFKHNKVLHQQVVILSIVTDAKPEVSRRRLRAHQVLRSRLLGRDGALRLHADARRPAGPARLRGQGLYINENETSFYLGRETASSPARAAHGASAQAPFRFPLAATARSAPLLLDPPTGRESGRKSSSEHW